MKKLFTLILLITCLTSVKAYENDYFTIDIPEGYVDESKDTIYKWSNDNNYISITITDNKNTYNIEKYTDKDLKEQKQYLENIYSSGLQDYNMTVEVSDVNRDTINDYEILIYDVYWPSEQLTGHNIYQKGAVYTTKNYIYTILVNSDEEIHTEDFKKLLNTFSLKDEKITTSSHLLFIILIAGTALGIIGYFIDRKKKEHK